jgi:ribosome maturation factor RimP
MTLIEDISQAIRPAIEASGNFLEEVTLTQDGSSQLMSVIVDNENHLNLDEVTVLTKAISEILDTLEVLGETPFTLEVGSPGLDRPLTQPRHWKKNHGRLVSVELSDGTKVLGRIGDLTDAGVIVDETTLNFADIDRAVIEIEFKKVGA